MPDNRTDDDNGNLDNGGHDGDLNDIATMISSLGADDRTLLDPPDEIWEGIVAAIGDADGVADTRSASPSVTPITSTPTVRSLEERRRTAEHERQSRSASMGRPMLLAAAAAIIVVAAVAAVVMTRSDDASTIATASLDYDATAYDPLGVNAVASVRLVDDDGDFRIEFDEAELPASELHDEDLEMWLLRVDDTGSVVDLVSLGVVDAIDRSYTVPEGYDPDDYSVVDISVEPRDGDEQHSGRTILRGPLNA